MNATPTHITWRTGLRMTRPGFLVITVVACLMGLASAAAGGSIDPVRAIATVLLAVIAHASANVLNDYHDALNGADAANSGGLFPFTGGARMIQNGDVSVLDTRRLAQALALLVVPAGLVLAAGSGSRMGGANKLLQPVGGIAMVRRVANAALASRCVSVRVVTGFAAEELRASLAGLDLDFTHNPEHASGMASSLRCGLAALADDVDAVVVLLADMPCIDGRHIDRLIDAFDPDQAKIVVPMKAGRRGNPILWPRAFFAEMRAVSGDVGARDLLQRHVGRIEAVDFDDDAIFADVDTPAALSQLDAG